MTLELRGLSKTFGATHARGGATHALDGVSFRVGERELVVVLGAVGAGKTTLLRCIAGLAQPDAGTISIGGADVTNREPAARDAALVFQNFSLYPGKTVRGNLEFPLRAPSRRIPESEIRARAESAAQLLHIAPLLDRPARALSGGEMQRVAIGRAIVRRPQIFLMDEPLTNLDAKLREELRSELRELARKLATPVLWVTHDPGEALAMADRIVILRSGRVLQIGTPEDVYFRPASPEAARALGSPPVNVLDARLESGRWLAADGTELYRVAAGAAAHAASAAARARIGFRPEHVQLSGGASRAVVEVVEDMGPASHAVARWAGARIHIVVDRGRAPAAGDAIYPAIDAAHILLWPEA